MGKAFSGLFNRFGKNDVRVLLLGLDAAGKTSMERGLVDPIFVACFDALIFGR
jgi:hypothetical protein